MQNRTPDHPIHAIFQDRWSPRAFDGQPSPQADLLTVLEAARWAPSAYNYQPWRFGYAHRGDAKGRSVVDWRAPVNAGWAQHASVRVFVLSDTMMHGEDRTQLSASHSHSFDTGAAWAQLALQAGRLGYQARGMAGIDFARTRKHLGVPDRYRVEMAIAIGHPADPQSLPKKLHKGAYENIRRPIDEIAFVGSFSGS